MKAYLLSVAGIALFTSFCFIILPEGKLKKFIGGMLRLACTLVILTPVLRFLGRPADFSFSSGVSLQEDYLAHCESVLEEQYARNVTEYLKTEYGLAGQVRVELDGTALEKIFYSFSDSGMNGDPEHIHTIGQITRALSEKYGVEVVYENLAQ